MNKGEIKIYKSKNGLTEIQVRLENETVWLTQEQISILFNVQRPAITKHINNIFNSQELEENQVCSILEHTASDGKTYQTKFYNLDMIISVGYRVNSKQATAFRIWATNILRNYLVKGYTLNQKRLQEKGLDELKQTLEVFKKTLKSGELLKDEALGLLDIITNYTNTWLLLQQFDEDKLENNGNTKNLNYKLEAKEALEKILELKKNLLEQNKASELFGILRAKGGLESIFGNIYQTFGGEDLYTSVEEKAANLFYFLVKDHPFVDGNKRSGAFLFILFLANNNILFDKDGNKKINDRALVAITLLVAESNPKDKEIMIKLLVNLIN